MQKISMDQPRGRIDYLGAKKELTALLQTDLTPLIYSRFEVLYDLTCQRVQDLTRQEDADPDQVQKAFVLVMTEVQNWNAAIVDQEVAFLQEKLPKVESTYKALCIASIFVLNSVRFKQVAPPPVRLDIKPFKEYVHALYTCVGKAFARCPVLFEKDHSPPTRRKYEMKAYNIISDCVPTAIRSLLPVQKIYEDISRDIQGKKVWATQGPVEEKPIVRSEPKPEPVLPPEPPSPSPEEMARKTAASLLNAEVEVSEAKEKLAEMPSPPEEKEEEEEEEESSVPEEPEEVHAEVEEEEDLPPDPDYLPFESVKKGK